MPSATAQRKMPTVDRGKHCARLVLPAVVLVCREGRRVGGGGWEGRRVGGGRRVSMRRRREKEEGEGIINISSFPMIHPSRLQPSVLPPLLLSSLAHAILHTSIPGPGHRLLLRPDLQRTRSTGTPAGAPPCLLAAKRICTSPAH